MNEMQILKESVKSVLRELKYQQCSYGCSLIKLLGFFIQYWYIIFKVILMLVNIKDLISLTEANQKFSKVARTVDEKGLVIILKNNTPPYIVTDFSPKFFKFK